MSWGASFEQALTNFKERINSPIVNRFCALVLEASKSGGTIKKVFSNTSGFMDEMKDMDKEASAQMKPYIIVIYAAFAVFLVTAALLVRSFLVASSGTPMIMSQVSTGSTSGLKDFFYKDMLVSAITGGLMAGKLGERQSSGRLKTCYNLKHCGLHDILRCDSASLDVKKDDKTFKKQKSCLTSYFNDPYDTWL